MKHRTLSLLVVVGLVAGLVVAIASPAAATHFRFRDLTWRVVASDATGTDVELNLRLADRKSFYSSSSIFVGAPFQASVTTGDGGFETLSGQVISVNDVDDWFIAEVRGNHRYTGTGPYTASWQSCCTLSSLRNSPDSQLRTSAVIDFSGGNRNSPLSLVSPIVNLPATSGVQTFAIPSTDADGDNVSFRLATGSEALVTQPAGLTINSRTGTVSWDTTNRALGLWMVTIVLTDDTGGSSMNTFLINLGGTASDPPVWVAPTPPDRSQFSVDPGGSVSFTLAAQDPDGDPTVITPLAAPSGLSCSGTAGTGSYQLDCTWTPSQPSSELVAFDAQDNNGASAGLRSYRVGAGRYVAFGDSYQSGEGADDYEVGTDADVGGNGCRRSANAYPQLVAADPGTPSTLDFVACSGARTWHFYEAQHPTKTPPQPPQFDMAQLGNDVELITVGIGGNDSGFADILMECIFGFELLPFNDCSPDEEKTEQPVQDAFKRLRGEPVGPDAGGSDKTVPLATIYGDIRSMAPRARVIVVGYPQFFKTSGTLFFRCSGIKKGDQKWTNAKVKEMNDLIEAEAAKFGFEFADTSPYFEGHRLCEIGGGESREWFRDIQIDWDWPPTDPSAFHPDKDGHAAMAQAVLDVFNDPPPSTHMSTGDVVRFTVVVDRIKSWLSAIANWLGSDVEVTLISPSGQVYHRDAVPAGTEHLLGPTFEIFQVPNPEVGEWTIELYGADLGADGEPVWFSTSQADVPNVGPEAVLAYSVAGTTVSLDGSASFDPDGDGIVEYFWYINTDEGTIAELTGPVVDYTFGSAGDFGVVLHVVDARGGTGFAQIVEGITVAGGPALDVEGPEPPVAAAPALNSANAGRTIPIKWRLEEEGVPVDDPAAITGITTAEIGCAEPYAPIGTAVPAASTAGLDGQGDGRWHFNWDTEKEWEGTCRSLTIAFSDGSSLEILVEFK